MIINNLKIDESHPKEMLISAEVLIKREGKWYKVEYRKIVEDFNHKNFITTEAGRLRDRFDAIKKALDDMSRIDEHHIPITKENAVESFHGLMINEEFVW